MKRSTAKRLLLFSLLILALFSSALVYGASDELPRGSIIEKVVCKADATQSYALYLPGSYTPSRPLPVVFCFDPAARGRLPVELFKEAAEKYGYIVIGSNNSRNGPGVPLEQILQALFKDAFARLAINEKRIYTAGFSGGARVASSVGYRLSGKIAGVIACGAGFPPNLIPPKAVPFVLFGIAGTDDFNFPELYRLQQDLNSLAVANRFESFEGGHNWAPKNLCTEAIEWMEIQAMRSGVREKDETLIEDLFNQQLSKAREAEAAKKSYEAYVTYDAVARDFKNFKEVSEYEKKAAQLKATKEVKEEIRQLELEAAKQDRELQNLLTLKATIKEADTTAVALMDLRRAVTDLQKRSDEKTDSSARRVARRVVNGFYVNLVESSNAFTQAKKYDDAITHLEIASFIRPDNPGIHYRMACLYALKGQKKKALEALKKSVEKGFKDGAELQNNRELDAIREEAEFKKLVEDLRNKNSSG
jgi:poly(3-hydroxybutyrate) depolymerase